MHQGPLCPPVRGQVSLHGGRAAEGSEGAGGHRAGPQGLPQAGGGPGGQDEAAGSGWSHQNHSHAA